MACPGATRTRQTVCDPDRQAGRQAGTRKRVDIYKSGGPGDFARVASPKMMSDCHMLRMNVCDAGKQARRDTKKG